MTKKLEELFNVDSQEDTDTVDPANVVSTVPELQEALSNVDKIDAALPTVRDIETSDREMDEIADLAKDTFKDLMDLGMNVEARFSGEIFNNASRMLDTALNAKVQKVNKKLKMVDLQLKKANLDIKKKATGEDDSAIEAEGVVLDRNSLLDSVLNNKTPDK